MCAINPKHKATLTLRVYTSLPMTEEQFMDLVRDKALAAEVSLNADGRLRWHVEETANAT